MLVSCWTYLDAASNQVGDVLLTAALKPVEDEVSILFHLDTERKAAGFLLMNSFGFILTLFSSVRCHYYLIPYVILAAGCMYCCCHLVYGIN